MVAFYSNENFPLPVAEILRDLGHDVLTIQESGKAGQSTADEEVLAFAASEKRILLTFNRKHFIGLHRKNPNHSGIIVCTFDPDFAALAKRIHEGVAAEVSVAGKLLRVNRPQR